MRRILSILLAVVSLGSLAPCADAETRPKEPVSSYRNFLESHTHVRTLSRELVEKSRQHVLQATRDFESFLKLGTAEQTSGWKKYLNWAEMQQALAGSSPDVDILSAVLRRYRRDEKGLEQLAFTRIRSRLGDYLTLRRYAASDELSDVEHTLLDDLAIRLARYEVDPHRDDSLAIGERLAYLELSSGASPEVLTVLRERFDHPNSFLRVKNRMVRQMLKRDLNDERVFSRSDGQVTTRGTAYTTGKVSMQTSPSAHGAAFDVRMVGLIDAPNMVSRQRNVTVRSSCRTQVNAWKRITFTDTGFTLEPARAVCDSTIQINDISARGPVIEALAGRRADRKLPEFEQESAKIAQREITAQIDKEVETAIKEADHVYHDLFRTPLIRFGALPKRMDFSTTMDHVHATIHMTGGDRLGAPGEPPLIDPKFDIGLLLHESFIDNYCAIMFGGKTIRDKQWVNIMNIMTGVEPRVLWVHDRTDRWSFTFHEQRPLEVDFRDGLMTFTMRSSAVMRAGQTFERSVLIRAAYRMDIGRHSVSFVRQGDLVTRWDDTATDAGQQTRANPKDDELIAFLARKFNGVLQPEIHFDGLVPPAGGSLGKLRQIQIRKFDLTSGWMTIGFEVVAEAGGQTGDGEK